MSDHRKKPSVLILSKEGPGSGSGKALYRIHIAINKNNNFSSRFLAWEGTPDPKHQFFVNTNFLLNKVYTRLLNILNACIKRTYGPRPGFVFSHNLFPNLSVQSSSLIKEADIIFLGWIGFGYLSIHQFRLFHGKKIIWRFSDVWPLSGGCHVSFGCDRFQQGCHHCPQLYNVLWPDLAAISWKIKQRVYQSIEIKFIAPSRWMRDNAEKSLLSAGKEIHHIPTGVDLSIFRVMDKRDCRRRLNIDFPSTILLFGSVNADETSKGLSYVSEAINKLETKSAIRLVVFGEKGNKVFGGTPYPIQFLGRVEGDENLASVYNTADIFLAPYIDDNLPNTVIEAIACGLPVVGFDSGGMSDLVEHQSNGYLATPRDSSDMAHGIDWVIQNLDRIPFAETSRHRALNFSLAEQVERIEEIMK